ncbi:MAG: TPM domain-containing protein [Kofleriaceae bacterium]
MARGTSRRRELDVAQIRQAVEVAAQQTSAEIAVSIAPFFFGSVAAAAHRAFARLGISRPHARGGVLVFIVPARHEVFVLANERAHAQLGGEIWAEIATRIAAACARGDGTVGLIEGVEQLARALSEPFPSEMERRAQSAVDMTRL